MKLERLGLMVSIDHQRKGLGRILTVKANEIADEKGAATYVEAGPKAAALFRAEGFEELERLDINLEKFGAEGGTASMYIMKRDPQKRTQ
jgi:predicted N-acetyltransferase YhbS